MLGDRASASSARDIRLCMNICDCASRCEGVGTLSTSAKVTTVRGLCRLLAGLGWRATDMYFIRTCWSSSDIAPSRARKAASWLLERGRSVERLLPSPLPARPTSMALGLVTCLCQDGHFGRSSRGTARPTSVALGLIVCPCQDRQFGRWTSGTELARGLSLALTTVCVGEGSPPCCC